MHLPRGGHAFLGRTVSISSTAEGLKLFWSAPQVARTKHVGDSASRSGLTTSAAAQQAWFDFIHLYQGDGLCYTREASQSMADQAPLMCGWQVRYQWIKCELEPERATRR